MTRHALIPLALLILQAGCTTAPRPVAAGDLPLQAVPAPVEHDGRIPYVDYVPMPDEIKAQLETDGWKDVTIIREFPDYLQGPIRALSLYDLQSRMLPLKVPQEYGQIRSGRIYYLNLEFGADGIVTAPLVLPDGSKAVTFHVAVKQHYVMIIWNPAERAGYIWRSFIYDSDGKPTEMQFLMQRQDLARI